jgi:hypothetical protein
MCEPASLTAVASGIASIGTAASSSGFLAGASALSSVGQAAAGFLGASQQARRTNAAYRANAASAQAAAEISYANLEERGQQELSANLQKNFEIAQQAIARRGTAFAAAGESGIGGSSFDSLIGDLMMQESAATGAVDANTEFALRGIEAEKVSVFAGGQSRINSAPRADSPNPIPFMLQGTSGVLNAASSYFRPASIAAANVAPTVKGST